jgi:NADH:ubiquinone oxidoreductase subunit K
VAVAARSFRAPGSLRDDRVLPGTRILAIALLPVLLYASTVLVLFPGHTNDLWAWRIRAHMSSFALAVPYTAGIYFFGRLLLDGRWHRFAAGFLPVGTFVTAEGIATIVHWDLFTRDRPPFWLWTFLYLTTPFIVPALWWRNRTTDPGTPEDDDVELPRVARVGFLVAGVCQMTIAGFLLVFANTAVDIWPWPLTPLTARSTAGWFAFGLVGLMLARERRWSAARVVIEAMMIGFAIALIGVVRAWDEFDRGRVATWVFLPTVAAALILMLLLYVVMERERFTRRRRAPGGSDAAIPAGG